MQRAIVQLAQAAMCVYPERQGDFAFEPTMQRVQARNACLRYRLPLGELKALIDEEIARRPTRHQKQRLPSQVRPRCPRRPEDCR